MHWLLWMIPLGLLGPIMSIFYVTTPIERRIGGWFRELLALLVGVFVYFAVWHYFTVKDGVTLWSISKGVIFAAIAFPIAVFVIQNLAGLRQAKLVTHH